MRVIALIEDPDRSAPARPIVRFSRSSARPRDRRAQSLFVMEALLIRARESAVGVLSR
jgi:hypothetical protein